MFSGFLLQHKTVQSCPSNSALLYLALFDSEPSATTSIIRTSSPGVTVPTQHLYLLVQKHIGLPYKTYTLVVNPSSPPPSFTVDLR